MSRLLLQKAASRSLFLASRRLAPHSQPSSYSAFSAAFHSGALCNGKFQTKFDLPDPAVANANHSSLPLTKIVATIGPTSEQAEPLKQCVRAGLHHMRLNFSHATPEEVELRCANLKNALQVSKGTGRTQDVVSILLDTKGPELRTGKLANDTSGHDTVELVQGDTITLHAAAATLPDASGGSTASDLLIDFPVLAEVLEPGRHVLLDDGAVVLTVQSTDTTQKTATAVVQNSGSLRSRAGVNLPLADTAQHLPALSEKDKADIAYGMETADIDFVAASFVQTAQHVRDIRRHCAVVAESLPELWKDQPLPLIVSKIETASALQHFDEILEASDAIMVARGDVSGSTVVVLVLVVAVILLYCISVSIKCVCVLPVDCCRFTCREDHESDRIECNGRVKSVVFVCLRQLATSDHLIHILVSHFSSRSYSTVLLVV